MNLTRASDMAEGESAVQQCTTHCKVEENVAKCSKRPVEKNGEASQVNEIFLCRASPMKKKKLRKQYFSLFGQHFTFVGEETFFYVLLFTLQRRSRTEIMGKSWAKLHHTRYAYVVQTRV